MRKEILIVLFAVVVLSGCRTTSEGTSDSTPFIDGSEGLRISFVENAPPDEIFDNGGTNFDIVVKVENVGQHTIPARNVKLSINGILPAILGKSVNDFTDIPLARQLLGVERDIGGGRIPGESDHIRLSGLAYSAPFSGDRTLNANVCYGYRTTAQGDFCIRNSQRQGSAVCDVTGSKTIHSSAGPVKVVSLDESVGARDTVILRFTIRTVGGGSYFKPNNAGVCSSGVTEKNIIWVSVDTGITGLRCSGDGSGLFQGNPQAGFVRLDETGQTIVRCTQENVNFDAIQPVRLNIDYNHFISTPKVVKIKQNPQGTSSASTSISTSTSSTASTTTTTAGEGNPNLANIFAGFG